ncbi:PAS domain-containing sensor histidine kinase [Leisingera aquaemixtae]|uniref:PAS domain-containing sensor histidine kinase n=1 Tax=Leisingera aquaemixtae TaxID=1396826 RepID=UPI001C96A2E1|nr:PAS domain-containing sensor histidine kinase [Leisingera aquaemixtae]MBY6067743.1 PAS domain-containing sensor histidine kinase [Leisingera aquaemixtae]
MPTHIDRTSLTWKVTPDLLGVVDASGIFTDTNPAWFRTLGLLPAEIESRQFFDFLHPGDMSRTEAAFERLKHGEPVLQFENRYRHKDGSYRWLSWNAVPEGDRFICNARDVTQAKENAAHLANREQEAHFREQFIAVLGHDLRNPLSAVGAALRLLENEPQSAKALEILALGRQSVTRMSALINDILDFARSRLGDGIEIARSREAPLLPVLQQTVEEIRLANPDTPLQEDYSFADPLDCDPSRIAQLVSNLLANAVTHGTPGKPVQVSARDESGEFVLSVANEGTPIPPDTVALLFEPFTRAETRESQNGLGLGLFIAQQIAKGHGGLLSVQSDERLTVFSLRVPRQG